MLQDNTLLSVWPHTEFLMLAEHPPAVLHTSPMLSCLDCRPYAFIMLNMDDVMATGNMDLYQLLRAGDGHQMPVNGPNKLLGNHLHGVAPLHGF